MRPEKYVFLENGEKPCDKFESFYDCYEKYYVKKSFDNCTKCMPYQNMSQKDALPFCDPKNDEFWIMVPSGSGGILFNL